MHGSMHGASSVGVVSEGQLAGARATAVGAIVGDGAASEEVDDDDEEEEGGVEDGEHPPLAPHGGQHPSLAGVAVVAEPLRLVAPGGAVGVVGGGPSPGGLPQGGVDHGEAAVHGGLAAAGLGGGEMAVDEGVAVGGEIPADVGLDEAALDVAPVVVVEDVVLEIVVEVPGAVLPEAAVGDLLAHVLVGDEEGEDGEDDEGQDEEEGDQQVEVEQEVDPAEGAGDAQEGDQHHEYASQHEGHLQHLLAVRGVSSLEVDQEREPQRRRPHQERHHIHHAHHRVAHAKHFIYIYVIGRGDVGKGINI